MRFSILLSAFSVGVIWIFAQADDITRVVAKRIAARALLAAPICTAAVQ